MLSAPEYLSLRRVRRWRICYWLFRRLRSLIARERIRIRVYRYPFTAALDVGVVALRIPAVVPVIDLLLLWVNFYQSLLLAIRGRSNILRIYVTGCE
jgi:hypothetical protein